jgi:hypothetical protein
MALEGGKGVSVTPRPLFTPGKDSVLFVQEAGWAPGPGWTGAENLVPPPGFDLRTVQPVASRYTDHATRPTYSMVRCTGYSRWDRTQHSVNFYCTYCPVDERFTEPKST